MTTAQKKNAPGAPGRDAHWAWGAKSGVGTALSASSPVWFTLSHGILTEVYFPELDTACIRDLEFLVADGEDFFAEEKRDTDSEVSYLHPGVPAFRVVNTCRQGRFRIEKTVLADPHRAAVLQQVQFVPLQGKLNAFALFALLTPHLGNQGAGNTGWVGDFKGVPMLFAKRDGLALALACSSPWRRRSAGFVGTSDGWTVVSKHRCMKWTYERAEDGNVALTGEIDLAATDGKFLLALGFGRDESQAAHQARASLLQGFEAAQRTYVRDWSDWLKEALQLEGSRQHPQDLYRISAAVMRTHEGKSFPGALIASLAVPWGEARGDADMGYHLVWPRDMIEIVGGQLACLKHEDARRGLFYFEVTQDADGHWPQNMWLDGRPCWGGIQLDETAFVILLVGLGRREGALNDEQVAGLWPMVRRAAAYLVQHGPVTPMDRWEEGPGYYASTMAVEIPALLVAAELAEEAGEAGVAAYLRETADAWNDSIDELIYARGTDFARRAGVDGYYVRFAGPEQMEAPAPAYGLVTIKNQPKGEEKKPAAEVVGSDALTLVRFGLRAANDPRILNTVRVIDLFTKVDTPGGPCWHRYLYDGYGEHADGTPFDGTGIGRAWPLLTGERAHYELAAGRKDEAERLLRTLESFASASGLLPEQVWDSKDIPQRELFRGKPSGSAMPLVWAHAEYLKLRRSLHDGHVFDLPALAARRYLEEKRHSPHACWRPDQRRRALPAGKVLRLELPAPALVRWSDGERATHQLHTRDSGLGVHFADLQTQKLAAGSEVVFHLGGHGEEAWRGQEFRVQVECGAS